LSEMDRVIDAGSDSLEALWNGGEEILQLGYEALSERIAAVRGTASAKDKDSIARRIAHLPDESRASCLIDNGFHTKAWSRLHSRA